MNLRKTFKNLFKDDKEPEIQVVLKPDEQKPRVFKAAQIIKKREPIDEFLNDQRHID